MKNAIYPCLWFDGNAKAAADFYCSIFNNSKIVNDTPLVVSFEIEGKLIMGLNGGPMFKINPSISLFVTCETDNEIERLYAKLIEGGSAMMPLDEYAWSKKYAWVVDKFGMTWQLMLGEWPAGRPKILPCFLFVGNQYGRAQEAIRLYTTIFPNSKMHRLEIYEEGDAQPAGNLKFGDFNLQNELFGAMDGFGVNEFQFNEGVSLVVECDTQEEIDNYWKKLTEGGEESQCGWLKDKFGVSWQIVPTILSELMSNPEKAPRVVEAFMKMKKFDIETLLRA
ncbi:Glyoxalase superfamily enzyme, possibly 3-demethylubiquinone-9 3-methyltransferase [Flavobacterium fluvii]|uniref:Glyoxalase superfamily enzyme, possibly 3-demethylubiquinone-9 3-methyltransferase n=1 Tax=Flavobacterium fluvii TaxID=468056 RepID=A0A1M5NGB9_9FLAO|nr:VOC family protein [Flavobacterium fluvii]SHG88636.1 Glyoxalase superfamily enzyme, possibly 3-demethylubiquinone-9 3-methyltransferase [Flavobacterium fluvii]